MCLLIYLFRVPDRNMSPYLDDSFILAPCDGTIINIEEAQANMIKISIHLSIFDVHTQWYPVNGIIRKTIHNIDKSSLLSFLNKSKNNEKFTTIIQHTHGIVRIDQIAGQFGERIVNWSKSGKRYTKGALMGMIKFSSQVDILLPSYKVDILSNIDDNIIGKNTPIAKWI